MDPSDPESLVQAKKGFSARGSVMEHEVSNGPQCFKCGAVCKDKAHYRNHLLSHYYRYISYFYTTLYKYYDNNSYFLSSSFDGHVPSAAFWGPRLGVTDAVK